MQKYDSELSALAPWVDIMDNIHKNDEIEHADKEFLVDMKQTLA